MRINEIAPGREKQVKALKKKFDDKGAICSHCMGPNTTNTANKKKNLKRMNVMKLKQY